MLASVRAFGDAASHATSKAAAPGETGARALPGIENLVVMSATSRWQEGVEWERKVARLGGVRTLGGTLLPDADPNASEAYPADLAASGAPPQGPSFEAALEERKKDLRPLPGVC